MKYVKIIFAVVFAFGFVGQMGAQKPKLKVETSVSGGTPVLVDDTYHALAGSSANYHVTITDIPETDSLDAAHEFKIESEQIQTYTGNLNSGYDFAKLFPSEGTYTFSVRASYKRGRMDPRTIRNYDDTSDSTVYVWNPNAELVELEKVVGLPVQVYANPTAGLSEDDLKIAYLTTDRPISISTEGGNDSGWKYKLNNGSEVSAKITSIPKSSPLVYATTSSSVVVTNYAPDGKTQWYTKTYTLKTYFYNDPQVSVAADSEKKVHFYKTTGASAWKIEAKDNNPSNGWTVTWSGGQSTATGFSYNPFADIVTGNQLAKTLKAEVKYVASDKKVLYEDVITFDKINVYEGLKPATKGATESMAIYSGEEVSFAPQDYENAASPARWEYIWSDGSTDKTLTANPSSTESYKVTAEYKYNDEVWDKYEFSYPVTVFNRPSASLVEDIVVKKSDGTTMTINPKDGASLNYQNRSFDGQNFNLVVGDKIQLRVNPVDGAANWGYAMSDTNGNSFNTSNAEFAPTEPGEYSITVNVVNGMGIVNAPYEGTITRKFTVYPVPELDLTSVEYNVYSGEKKTITAQTINDLTGWSYNWKATDPSTIDEDGCSVVVSNEVASKKEFIYTLTSVYTVEDVERYREDKEYKLIVWPAPALASSGEINLVDFEGKPQTVELEKGNVSYPNTGTEATPYVLLVGDNLTINAGGKDGIDDKWLFKVYLDDNLMHSEENTCSYALTVQNPGTHMIKVVATNGEGIAENHYVTTITRLIDVYSITPEEKTETRNVYSGEFVELKASKNSNDAIKGWDYKWKDLSDDSELELGETSSTLKVSKNVESKKTYLYKYVSTYSCQGIKRLEQSSSFSVNVWPVASVALTGNVSVKDNEGKVHETNQENNNADMANRDVECEMHRVLPGDKLNFDIVSTGGIDDSWIVTVLDNGKEVSTQSSGVYVAEEVGIHNITVLVENGKKGSANEADKPYVARFTRSVEVYPIPEVDNISPVYHVYSGESKSLLPAKLLVDERNGWDYEWTASQEGVMSIDGRNAEISKQVSEHEDLKIVHRSSFALEGVTRYVKDNEYHVHVWPAPSATLSDVIAAVDYQKNTTDLPQSLDIDYNNKSINGDTRYLILGDKVTFSMQKLNGGIAGDWHYTFKNGSDILENDATAEFRPTKAGTYTIDVEVTNGEGKDIEFRAETPYTAHLSRKYVVYDKPSLSQTPHEINTMSGYTETFRCPVDGGDANGWSYSWDEGSSTKEQNVRVENVTSRQEKTVVCAVKNVCEGVVRLSETPSYKLVVWPTPTLDLVVRLRDKNANTVKDIKYFDLARTPNMNTVDIECFDEDVLDISYNAHGGYTGEENCWKYENSLYPTKSNISYLNNSSQTDPGNDSYVASSSGEANATQTFNLKVTNQAGTAYRTINGNWYEKNIVVNVKAWRNAVVTVGVRDSIAVNKNYTSESWKNGDVVDVYAGNYSSNAVDFNISHEYGKTDGNAWSYTWKDNGTWISNSDTKYTYTPVMTNSNSNYQDHTFTVEVVNGVGGNNSHNKTYTYNARVWRKAEMSNSFELYDANAVNVYGQNEARLLTGRVMKIRKGNNLRTSIDEIRYGYRGSDGNSTAFYRYVWNDGGPQNQNEWDKVMSMSESNDHQTTTYTRRGHLEVVGPYGNIWDRTAETEQVVTIYNRPKTPTSLTKKGNGTSGTMICTTSLSDRDLESHRYFLVFGYKDSEGKYHDLRSEEQKNVGEVRWNSNFTTNEVNLPANRLYVYALWRYDESDGVQEITSGIRYADGAVDENWDRSAYDLPTASTRAGGDFVDALEDVRVDDESGDVKSIYSVSGIKLGKKQKGVNVVRRADGTVKKVMQK